MRAERAWTIRVGGPGQRVQPAGRRRDDAAPGQITREGVLDLVFEVRPVFSGPIPAGMEPLVPLQAEVLAAAEELREVLPGESGADPLIARVTSAMSGEGVTVMIARGCYQRTELTRQWS